MALHSPPEFKKGTFPFVSVHLPPVLQLKLCRSAELLIWRKRGMSRELTSPQGVWASPSAALPFALSIIKRFISQPETSGSVRRLNVRRPPPPPPHCTRSHRISLCVNSSSVKRSTQSERCHEINLNLLSTVTLHRYWQLWPLNLLLRRQYSGTSPE